MNNLGIITTSAMIGMPESAKLDWIKKRLGILIGDDLEVINFSIERI